MNNFLEQLILNKKKEVATLKVQGTLSAIEPRASNKSFKAVLEQGHAVIAEIKRQSPSKSHLANIQDPVALAQRYVEGGAAAISVLTDFYGFGGSINDLKVIAQALSETTVPVLRKDFIIDPIQIAESVLIGADAVLLIVAALKQQTEALLDVARAMNIEALVEVMNQDELAYALSLSPDVIVVNNRDLTTFNIDSKRAVVLSKTIPHSVISVAASGMNSPENVADYFAAGYNAVLVGEALVKADNPVQFIRACREHENGN